MAVVLGAKDKSSARRMVRYLDRASLRGGRCGEVKPNRKDVPQTAVSPTIESSVLARIEPITNPTVKTSLGESYYSAMFFADGASSPSTGSGVVFLSESAVGVNATVPGAWLMVHPLQVVELPSETVPVEDE